MTVITGWSTLVLCIIFLVLFNDPRLQSRTEMSLSSHRRFCLIVGAAACCLRLLFLVGIPEGISAEEALTGVQARMLWKTGHFLRAGALTTQLPQWTGESTGPLLAYLTAPFVGIFGMSAFMTRLPLALMSCLALPAFYGIGKELSGRRLGRNLLLISAFAPLYVISARLTAGANLALFLLPVCLYCLLRGFRQVPFMFAGMVLTGLMAYSQDLYLLIAPALVLISAVLYLLCLKGRARLAALGAFALGALLSIPAVLTLQVNLAPDAAGMTWGPVEIPRLKVFDKLSPVMKAIQGGTISYDMLKGQFRTAVILGGVMQTFSHMNLAREMLLPNGLYALFLMTIPLEILGALVLVHRLLTRRKMAGKHVPLAILLICAGMVTVLALVLLGSEGRQNKAGVTGCYDYASQMAYLLILAAIGLDRVEFKSRTGAALLAGLVALNAGALGVHLFSGQYNEAVNTYFLQFREIAEKAEKAHEQTGKKVVVTSEFYPHIAPEEAAEMIYLYAANPDMTEVAASPASVCETVYPDAMSQLSTQEIYLMLARNLAEFDTEGFEMSQSGVFALAVPRDTEAQTTPPAGK